MAGRLSIEQRYWMVLLSNYFPQYGRNLPRNIPSLHLEHISQTQYWALLAGCAVVSRANGVPVSRASNTQAPQQDTVCTQRLCTAVQCVALHYTAVQFTALCVHGPVAASWVMHYWRFDLFPMICPSCRQGHTALCESQ